MESQTSNRVNSGLKNHQKKISDLEDEVSWLKHELEQKGNLLERYERENNHPQNEHGYGAILTQNSKKASKAMLDYMDQQHNTIKQLLNTGTDEYTYEEINPRFGFDKYDGYVETLPKEPFHRSQSIRGRKTPRNPNGGLPDLPRNTNTSNRYQTRFNTGAAQMHPNISRNSVEFQGEAPRGDVDISSQGSISNRSIEQSEPLFFNSSRENSISSSTDSEAFNVTHV